MAVFLHTQASAQQNNTSRPTAKQEMQRLAGVLWYEMLSTLNKTGMDASSLGMGGGDFQSMFLWNLAQNDFGKYDKGLIQTAVSQVGGTASEAPAPATSTAVMLAAKVNEVPVSETALPATDATPSADIVSQASSFAKAIWPQITAAAQALGVPAVAVLAQTALETGWGASAPGDNLFGIKAKGDSGTVRATHEDIGGELTPQLASFRDYNSLSGSISDYVSLIKSSYQSATGQNSVAGFAQALQAGGYATDENYASKIERIAQSPLMSQVLQAVGAAQPSQIGAEP
ncbi:glycoside hydrolase family 73 protein [Acidocella aminolytica]|jgi:flagellar protein FlgJ|uniref:Flagellar protein FlgJ n=1 Tax=Acidocella aminolytica 101 = DSM 11237 TaxID=1120923 RepID=A0A0D6PFP0_9PROT|nr:glucosaminidase domain-containing protein [Acidocella aminolytica]GAN80033.1 flagellar protein FlgJ [Acidocella aminolytica 101 = DSM 11237]GBQ40594.1 flagellar protein flgJ [Acidocella aminolytica 101 = DSM 11237]SHF08197.1 flagellar protein FlgJ [Acidocella aminolytica 101 = DSM 11237]